MKVLVTGGVGFIGSHVVRAYVERGDEVVVLDRRRQKRHAIPNAARVISEDINHADLKKLFGEEKFDVVNHLAAQVNVRRSLNDPAYDAQENIMATLRLVQAATDCEKPPHKFIFSSSGGAIYGDQPVYPIPEEAKTFPISPYGIAKLCCETYLRFFQNSYGLKTVILRYANVYGPGQDPSGEAGVISIFIDSLIQSERPTIFGDGSQTRDFVYVEDVARANLAATDRNVQGCFNIGSGDETTVNELYSQIAALLKSDITAKQAASIPGELSRSYLNIEKADRELHWKPMTNLEDGLSKTIAAIRATLNPEH